MSANFLVSHYLASTGLHAVLAFGAEDGTGLRLLACAGGKLRATPAKIALVGVWWVRDEALATRLVECAYDLAAAGGVARSRAWLQCPAGEADGLVRAAGLRLGAQLVEDAALRVQARAAIDAIDADMEQRRRSGALKSVNRDYAEQRAAAVATGERMPAYGDFMLGLKRRAVSEAAARRLI